MSCQKESNEEPIESQFIKLFNSHNFLELNKLIKEENLKKDELLIFLEKNELQKSSELLNYELNLRNTSNNLEVRNGPCYRTYLQKMAANDLALLHTLFDGNIFEWVDAFEDWEEDRERYEKEFYECIEKNY
jgi:hypothetical protein